MKKTGIILLIVFLGIAIWYLFVKPYDYLATFETKATTGTINQSLKSWSASIDKSSEVHSKELNELNHTLTFNDSIFMYDWEITPVNDSVSKVAIYVKESTYSLTNKVKRVFLNTDFEKRTKRTILDFHKKLNDHLKKFKVTIIGESEFKSTYCIYIPLKGTQIEKAKGMMKNYGLLNNFIVQHGIELNGRPVVEITKWDIRTDSIEYNFCYPVKKQDSLINHKFIRYKQLKDFKGLKAIYNGNYITSDRAWYSLHDYANKNNIKIEENPTEIFHNNPNMGGDELKWKTEVFIPIK